MNRRAIATRLSLLVALAGIVPIGGVGAFSIELLRRRSERAAQEALSAIAEQQAAEIDAFLSHQRELVRAVAAVVGEPNAQARLEEVVLDAPSLGRVTLVGPDTPAAARPKALDDAAVARALAGEEVSSSIYLAQDTTPAMDVCTPARALPGRAVCARLDLLELWRFVQRMRIGESGYALAFDAHGKILASGAGTLRGAILTGEPVPETPIAVTAAADPSRASTHYVGPDGEAVLAGWARLPKEGWTVAVEQPVAEALRAARTAQWILAGAVLLALILSVGLGAAQSQRVMREVEVEERWRTAGRLAAGIAHDLGHRLRILQQTAALAEDFHPEFLPRIQANLRAELGTLQKFVAEFLDLSRDPKSVERSPLQLGAFLSSVARTAAPFASASGVELRVSEPPGPVWVEADRHLLERAALNLISNAIEASDRGGAVRLSCFEESGVCQLEVSDDGAGIPADRLPQLFEAFVSTKRTGAHLGMGLPNVKRIVEAHGGSVTVESTPGKGTRFRLALPTARAPAPSVGVP